MKTSLVVTLLLVAAVAGCGEDGADGGGGSGGGGGGGGTYAGRATVIVMNPGPGQLTYEIHDADAGVQTADLAPGERAIFQAGLVEGSTLDDELCLIPDVREPGETETISALACAQDGDVVAVAGKTSTSRSQLPAAPAAGVQIAHVTVFDEEGQFFMVDPTTGDATQVFELGELAVAVALDGALAYRSETGDFITYADSGWLAAAGFTDGARLVTMATDPAATPALHFVACELAEELDCVEVAAP